MARILACCFNGPTVVTQEQRVKMLLDVWATLVAFLFNIIFGIMVASSVVSLILKSCLQWPCSDDRTTHLSSLEAFQPCGLETFYHFIVLIHWLNFLTVFFKGLGVMLAEQMLINVVCGWLSLSHSQQFQP